MEKKEVFIVWDYPQLTDDPTAIVIDLETGKKIDEATLDCTNFRTGGKYLTPLEPEGSYSLSTWEEDLFKKDNSEFLSLPDAEERYLNSCFGNGTVGIMKQVEKIFLNHFKNRYEVKTITSLRKVKTDD